MRHVTVIQHTQSEWLGAIEDHLEGRNVRFGYVRPFVAGTAIPAVASIGDGLILLGGGPWGAATPDRLLPTLDAEVRLARACLMLERPVIGIGLGAQILSLAADGAAEPRSLRLEVVTARRVAPDALDGLLPAEFPCVVYGRDGAVPPAYARLLAVATDGRPAMFQIGRSAFGLAGHPGCRPAMIEDLVMEFEEAPEDVGEGLAALARLGTGLEDALVPIMSGLVAACGWMEPMHRP